MVKDTSVTAQFKIVKNDLSDFLFENSEDVFLPHGQLHHGHFPLTPHWQLVKKLII